MPATVTRRHAAPGDADQGLGAPDGIVCGFMDERTVAEELYGLALDEFTPVRTQRAKEARAAGDRDLARRITELRKPTVAAWALNMLIRQDEGEVDQLLTLGEQLRQAQASLAGEALRELTRQRHQVVAALARRARGIAAQLGHPFGESVEEQLRQTLLAALADAEAAEAVRSGMLTSGLSHVGLGSVEVASSRPERPAPASRAPAPRPARRPEPAPERDQPSAEVHDLADARNAREARAAETERRRALEAARSRARDAARAADKTGAALRDAEQRVQAAQLQADSVRDRRQELRERQDETRERRQAAQDRLAALQHELAELLEDLSGVQDQLRDNDERLALLHGQLGEAQHRRTEAADADRVAQQELERAQAALDELES
jgi:hypothetical protein